MKKDLGKQLSIFAVIADTHMNQNEEMSTSPFMCNLLSNARVRQVVAELNELNPDFVLHLGDIINPVPHLPSYVDAAACFLEVFEDLKAPLHIVPGNHDIGDKPSEWMPAGSINNNYIELFRKHFGRDYYSVDYGDLHIVIINAQLLNSGLIDEEKQRLWFEQDLKNSFGKRIFVGTHYPPYITHHQENGNYDNIDEPGRSWFLECCTEVGVEAIFGGHVQNFFYNRYKCVDNWVLPSTCFVRHDYSHLFHGTPGDEYGRNDTAKLGYFVVKVYEKGHVCHVVRSYGRCLKPQKSFSGWEYPLNSVHLQEAKRTPMGVELRHAWGRTVELPASGAIDEFERKFVRNDYTLMALWEMGMGPLRVPLHDLLDENVRTRMQLLVDRGHRFTVYSLNLPQGKAFEKLAKSSVNLDAFELVIPWSKRESMTEDIKNLKTALNCDLVLSRLHGFEEESDVQHFSHCVSHGFLLSDIDELSAFLVGPVKGSVDRCSFTIFRDEAPLEFMMSVDSWAKAQSLNAHILLRIAGNHIADVHEDDGDTSNRIAEALLAAHGSTHLTVFSDTFCDIDRGHFVRNGLVDTRYNPRQSARMFKVIQSWILKNGGKVQNFQRDGNGISFTCGLSNSHLLLTSQGPQLT